MSRARVGFFPPSASSSRVARAVTRGASRGRPRVARASARATEPLEEDDFCARVDAWEIRRARARDVPGAVRDDRSRARVFSFASIRERLTRRARGQADACAAAACSWRTDLAREELTRATTSGGAHAAVVAVPAPGEALEDDARVVGAVGFCVVLEGETQVTQLCARPSARRRGLGARVLRAMIGLKPTNTCVLEVRADNAGAIALYEKCGFVETGRRKRYYADGADAICMTREPERERPVSTRELTRLLAGLNPDLARKEAPPLPNAPEAKVRETADAPRDVAFDRAADAAAFKMRNRIRRAPGSNHAS